MIAARDERPERDVAVALGVPMLVALPVVVGIVYAGAAAVGIAGAGARGLTAEHLVRVLLDRATWGGLAWSLAVGAVATMLAATGAVAIAVLFRGPAARARVARVLATAALPVPHLVTALLGLWVLGQSGMLARVAQAAGLIAAPAEMPALVYDRYGMGLALTMAWKELAFLTVVAVALLATRTTEAEESARTLGASAWQTFRLVTWPVLWRGLAPSVIAVYVFAVGNWEMAALLAPSDPLALPLLLAERSVDADLTRRGDAHVVALLLLAVGVVGVVLHEWARARWEPLGS